jgi:hypothetical protein
MSKIKKIEKVYDEIRSRFDKLGGSDIFFDYGSEKLKPIVVGNDENEIKAVYNNLVDMSPFAIYNISEIDKLLKKTNKYI